MYYLTLKAKRSDGTFDEDNDIDVNIQYGQRLSDILYNVNARRPSASKIDKIYNQFGQLIPLSHKMKASNTFYYILDDMVITI
jgi:hypothetical protein